MVAHVVCFLVHLQKLGVADRPFSVGRLVCCDHALSNVTVQTSLGEDRLLVRNEGLSRFLSLLLLLGLGQRLFALVVAVASKRPFFGFVVIRLIGILPALQIMTLRVLVVQVVNFRLRRLAEVRKSIHVVLEQPWTLGKLLAAIKIVLINTTVTPTQMVADVHVWRIKLSLLLVVLREDGHKRSVSLVHVR